MSDEEKSEHRKAADRSWEVFWREYAEKWPTESSRVNRDIVEHAFRFGFTDGALYGSDSTLETFRKLLDRTGLGKP